MVNGVADKYQEPELSVTLLFADVDGETLLEQENVRLYKSGRRIASK